jgi:hypothetical protein
MKTQDSKREAWSVSGRILERETHRPLSDLIVRAFDRDWIFDDKLGFATSDADGCFEIRFGAEAFRDAFETRPDIYLQVFDQSGTRLLHETSDAIRWNASRRERYEVLIPARDLDPRRRRSQHAKS